MPRDEINRFGRSAFWHRKSIVSGVGCFQCIVDTSLPVVPHATAFALPASSVLCAGLVCVFCAQYLSAYLCLLSLTPVLFAPSVVLQGVRGHRHRCQVTPGSDRPPHMSRASSRARRGQGHLLGRRRRTQRLPDSVRR